MSITVQFKYVHRPSTTNWGASDDRHCLHLKYFVDGYQILARDVVKEGPGKDFYKWCIKQFGKPQGTGSQCDLYGVWIYSSDYGLFIFKNAADAMLMKMTWASK